MKVHVCVDVCAYVESMEVGWGEGENMGVFLEGWSVSLSMDVTPVLALIVLGDE